MPLLADVIRAADGTPVVSPVGAPWRVRVSTAGDAGHPVVAYTGDGTVVAPAEVDVAVDGTFTVDLPASPSLTPAGVVYHVEILAPTGTAHGTFRRAASLFVTVPDTPGPHGLLASLVDPPGAVPSAALAVHAGAPVHVPDPSGEPDGRWLRTEDGALVYVDASADAPVESVNGQVGAVVLTADDVDAEPAGSVAALDAVTEKTANRGQPDGYPGLDANSKIATEHLPAIALTEPFPVESEAEMLALDAQPGDVAIRTDQGRSYILARDGDPTVLADWLLLHVPEDPPVDSVNGKVGTVVLTAADVGAETEAGAQAKADAARAYAVQRGNHEGTQPIGTVDGLQDELDALASGANVAHDASAFTADDLLVVNDLTDGVVTVTRVAGAAPVVNFDAGADADTARPSVPAAWTVIWRNTPSEPTNLGALDMWEDAS